MNTKLLKQKILDLAIRGKLVPQDPNDEPASELLKRILAEKEKLIAEGKIKRSKKTGDKPHYEKVPFEIPNNWTWTTIGELLINRDSERIPLSTAVRERQTNKIYDYYGAAGVIDKVDNFIFSEKLLLIGEDGANLLSRSKDNAFFADGKYWVNNHAHVLDCTNKLVLDFVAFVINASSLDKYITGSAQPKLSQDSLNKILIPLPPLDEQRRLIDAKNKWFALIDELELNKQDLQEVVQQTKYKVLDLAIHGKLVEQEPNDETAIDLLKRINPNAAICDTSHYGNLPKGWCSATIKQLCDVMGGLWTGKKPPYVNVGVIRNTNFSKDFKLDLTNVAYLDVERHQYEKRKLQYGDLILEKSGGSDKQPVGRVILYDNEEGDFSYSNFTSRLRIKDPSVIIPQFLFYALLYAYLNGETQSMQKQTTGIHNLIMDKYLSVSVPVPPINEQDRIVQKIQEIEERIREICAEL